VHLVQSGSLNVADVSERRVTVPAIEVNGLNPTLAILNAPPVYGATEGGKFVVRWLCALLGGVLIEQTSVRFELRGRQISQRLSRRQR